MVEDDTLLREEPTGGGGGVRSSQVGRVTCLDPFPGVFLTNPVLVVYRINPALGAPSSRRWKEEEEEELHHSQEDQAQA